MDWTLIAWGTLAGLATGMATFAGALPAAFGSRLSAARQNAILGFAAGVMLSASYLSLIVPAAAFAEEQGLSSLASAAEIAVAVLAGAATLDAIRRSRWMRSLQAGGSEVSADSTRRVWLLFVAMTAHNLPEGAAVGVSFGANELRVGVGTAIGIGVQNIPEGLAVAAALLTIGFRPAGAVLLGGATGLVEPVGAFLGASLVSTMSWMLPAAMAWAAGAMIYIVAAELIPAVHSNGNNSRAIWAFLIGVSAMLLLDIGLG